MRALGTCGPQREGRDVAAHRSPDLPVGDRCGAVAAVALRAAGAATPHPNPAAFSCHYLGVARFEPVDVEVSAAKEGRAASSHRVSITQDSRPILEALVWSTADNDGLEHDESSAPAVPGPDELPSIRDLVPEDAAPPFPFWLNFDAKPIDFEQPWPPDGPRPAVWRPGRASTARGVAGAPRWAGAPRVPSAEASGRRLRRPWAPGARPPLDVYV